MADTETSTLIAITTVMDIAASNIDAIAPSFSEKIAIPIPILSLPVGLRMAKDGHRINSRMY
jgi:hypothetical protein